jgi:glyoxylase-like metal-dependent hydrolase (beta-lactamase superfamily II)
MKTSSPAPISFRLSARIPICLLAFSLFHAVTAPAQSPTPFNLVSLDHGTFAAIDNPAAKEAESGANAGFVIGPTGVAVVDTFENPDAAKAMLAAIQEKTKLPIRFVVNTHYHLDHVAGNEIFATAGAVVMAQENVRTWERSENLKFFGPTPKAEQRKFVETLGLPAVTYATGATVYLGDDRSLILRVLPGHTGGDTVVYDPAANVVFCGDLFWNHTLPNLIDASTDRWIETLDKLLNDYPTAAFIPGHGDPGHAADVRAFRDYLIFLRAAIAQAHSQGQQGDALLKTVLPQVKEKYGDWNFFEFATPDIQRTDEELRGVKKIPKPKS